MPLVTIGINNQPPDTLFNYYVGNCNEPLQLAVANTESTQITVELDDYGYNGGDYCYRICITDGEDEFCCCDNSGTPDPPVSLTPTPTPNAPGFTRHYAEVTNCCNDEEIYTAEITYPNILPDPVLDDTFYNELRECFYVSAIFAVQPPTFDIEFTDSNFAGNNDCDNTTYCNSCTYRLIECGTANNFMANISFSDGYVPTFGPGGDSYDLSEKCGYFQPGGGQTNVITLVEGDLNTCVCDPTDIVISLCSNTSITKKIRINGTTQANFTANGGESFTFRDENNVLGEGANECYRYSQLSPVYVFIISWADYQAQNEINGCGSGNCV
jgi:hypothetical protein